MSSIKLFAGFTLSVLNEHLRTLETTTNIEALKFLCEFQVDGIEVDLTTEISIYAVASNLISRGLPTLPSYRIEKELSNVLNLTIEKINKIEIEFSFVKSLDEKEKDLITNCLAVVDPRIKERLSDADPVMQGAEPEFFNGPLLSRYGPWILQLTECQRPMSTLIEDSNDEFMNQMVDFSISSQQILGSSKGLIIEIDGSQHNDPTHKKLDDKRDRALTKANWKILRVDAASASTLQIQHEKFIDLYLQNSWIQRVKRNYENPLWEDSKKLIWMQAVLTPLLIARVQKTILQLALNSTLNPLAEVWRIAFIERDVPGSHLAADDLKELLENLSKLEGLNRKIPCIEYRIYRSSEFQSCEIAQTQEAEIITNNLDEILSFEADVVLDISILQRPGFSIVNQLLMQRIAPNGKLITLRTSFSSNDSRKIVPGDPIKYNGVKSESGNQALLYLLNNIFRKKDFREKQIDIIKEPLCGGSVAGILPTGAGKSICYQLPSLLQPGISIVIDPLKSLMRDQHDNLKRAGIDNATFLNSSLKATDREKTEKLIKNGGAQFVFVSPERFLIQEFRDTLSHLNAKVSYCVIDEAHCVSEWGHDFRTAYLRLGKAARMFCKTNWKDEFGIPFLPIVALTGTASFDVLSDIKRELEFNGKVPEVLPDSLERTELIFEIISVDRPLVGGMTNNRDIRHAVIAQKKNALRNLINRLPSFFNLQNKNEFFEIQAEKTNSGLIFTPHANKDFGVESVQKFIEREIPELENLVGRYASSDESISGDDLEKTQDKYKSNNLSLLVATKAFGMGIDKPNIRYVIHTNLSQSIESYYQEAGRAGRDRETAHCFILYCDQPGIDENDSANKGSVDSDFQKFFHSSSFKGEKHDIGALKHLFSGSDYAAGEPAMKLDFIVNDMPIGTSRKVVISFNDDGVDAMVNYLKTNVDPRINRGLISIPYEKSAKAEDFIQRLITNLGGKNAKNAPNFHNHEGSIATLFHKRRTKEDTFKAVYRLSIIGLIDDYVVDYKGGTITALIYKLSDKDYLANLQRYLERYVSPEEARKLPDIVPGSTSQGMIWDCLSYLIDFVYKVIAEKRNEALRQMEEAIRAGIASGPKEFTSRINTYFNSKYTEPLRKQLGFGLTKLDINIVWQFIDITEGKSDNVFHLRGACDRLLAASPDNGNLRLLRAFTRCLAHEDNASMFSDDFRIGWNKFRTVKDIKWPQYLGFVNKFLNCVNNYDSNACALIHEEILHIHKAWLDSFNNKFLAVQNV